MKKIAVVIMAAALVLVVGVIGYAYQGRSDVPNPTIKVPPKTTTISVFYATGNTLVEERHVVADDKNIVKTALNEVLAARPQNNSDIAIVQPECKVLSATVDKKGVATVNFSKGVLSFDAIPKEKVLAYGAFVETLKQFKQIKSVKFQVEGKENGAIGGKDVRKFWGTVSLIGQPWPLEPPKSK